LLIRGAEIGGVRCDIRLARARIGEAAPAGALARRTGEAVLDARGGALLPGLHDHHMHLMALAAARRSARCGPPAVREVNGLARALAGAPGDDGWIRGVGYHESVAGRLDRTRLDALRPDVPVRVQDRSGACWSLNSAALARLGALPGKADGVERRDGEPTGRLFDLDGWIRERLDPVAPPDLAPIGAMLARFGVTGVTDATATNGADALRHLEAAARGGALPQRLHVMGTLDLPPAASPRVTRAALKVVLAERALPGPESLAERFRTAHARGRSVAVHCTTRLELVLACTAFAAAGTLTGDRIEHASIAPPDVAALLADLGLTVVTQPNFVAERGDAYRRDVAPDDLPWLYRAAGLCAAGIRLGGGTDAPFGDADPWRAMAAAVTRRAPDGEPLGAAEALSPERALALFTSAPDTPGGAPRRVGPGADADLVLLDRPWGAARTGLASDLVRATWCAGELVHEAT
jgi:predicted amidohydrolase YtcJ